MPVGTLEVNRHRSELGRWEMASRAASQRLRPHVLGYCGYEEETVGFTRRRELPSGQVVLIIGFGPKVETTYPAIAWRPAIERRSFVAGLHETHALVGTPGNQAGIQVNLTPLGAHLLLGVPMRQLANTVVGLDDLLGTEAGLLTERLYECDGWEARFALLDRLLARRLDGARPATPDVAWAWRRLVDSGGAMPIGEICQEVGCSRKHLLQRFKEQIGLGPKAYARLVRFERAVRTLGHRDGPSWADGRAHDSAESLSLGAVAVECGYFDQAHMNREFRRLAGLSPGELAASLLPDGGGLTG